MALAAVPAERVWAVLNEPGAYESWVDARIVSIVPPGPVIARQRIVMHAPRWAPLFSISLMVTEVDAARHTVAFENHFPFGFTMETRISITPVDAHSSRVAFS